jgi:hypothetical protein
MVDPSDKEALDQLFVPKVREMKCQQQPYMTELFFDNNLNHAKELALLQK